MRKLSGCDRSRLSLSCRWDLPPLPQPVVIPAKAGIQRVTRAKCESTVLPEAVVGLVE